MTQRTMWATTGDNQDLEEKSIFINKVVLNYLEFDKEWLLVSSKGMGKTLLLRYKRKLLEDKNNGNTSRLIIPQGKNNSIDIVSLPTNLPDKLKFDPKLKNSYFWRDLWVISITLSFITYSINEKNKDHYGRFIESIKENNIIEFIFNNIKYKETLNPSDVISELLSLPISNIEKIRAKGLRDFYKIILKQQSSIYIFIDNFDRALEDVFDDIEIWNYGQIGLMEASYKINTANHHIKIYASIRQEAYLYSPTKDAMAMKGNILKLKYDKDELKNIFNQVLMYYENSKNIYTFLGLSKLSNHTTKDTEDVFDYLYRHTIGTPRSLMSIGKVLAGKKQETILSHDDIKSIINEQASEDIKDYLESEAIKFLTTLSNSDKFEYLISLIPNNILTYGNLNSIKNKYKKAYDNDVDTHPFCELYNIGLLGKILRKTTHEEYYQFFKKPYDFDWKRKNILSRNKEDFYEITKNEFYLLHPALYDLLKRRSNNFFISEVTTIGDQLKWTKKIKNKIIENIPQIFISYSREDSEKIKKLSRNLLEDISLKTSCKIWIDDIRVRNGEYIPTKITKGLRDSTILILILSNSSIKSKWVQKEWKNKLEDEKKGVNTTVMVILSEPDLDIPKFLKKKLAPKDIFTFDNNLIKKHEYNKFIKDIVHHLFRKRRVK